jgi:hypothetical protein
MRLKNQIIIFQKKAVSKPTASIIALGLFLSLFTTLLGIQNAFGLAVTVPANGTNTINYSANGAESVLTGYSVTPDNSGDILLVTITLENAPTGDRLKLTTNTNLSASYGYISGSNTFDSFTRISFTGTAENINAAFSSSFKYRSAGVAPTSAPMVKLSATLNTPGLAYFGVTDHFYKVGHFMNTSGAALHSGSEDDGKFCQGNSILANTYISAYQSVQTLSASATGSAICQWSEANRLARSSVLKGRPGYLANITSEEENDFLKENLNGALNVWMGGSDGTCNGESGYTRLGNSFDYIADTTIADRCSYSRNDVGGTNGQGNYTSSQSGGTEGAFHWYDGPEAGQTFWRYYESTSWTHSNWTTWASFARERTAYTTGNEDANSTLITTQHDRPDLRYVNWCWTSSGCHEPNNSSSYFTFGGVSNGVQGEDNIVFNWNTADGKWNDLHESEPTVPFYGYIIEYGDGTAFTGVASSTSTLRLNQEITFAGASTIYALETVDLAAATTNSGLTISYISSDTSVCTVAGTASGGTVLVTLISRGICAITASQAGNNIYSAALDVTQTFTSNYGTAVPGLNTDCSGIGALQNGGFETLPTVSENTASSFSGIGKWHGYYGANNNDPRIYLFLNPSGGSSPALDSWKVGTNTRIEIQRAVSLAVSAANVSAYSLSSKDQNPDWKGVNPSQGSYFAELNADREGTLYQDIATVPGTTLRWSLDHRGRQPYDRTDTMHLSIGPAGGTLIAQTPVTRPSNSGSGIDMTDARGSSATQIGGGTSGGWGTYTGVYTVPTGQTTTRFSFEASTGGGSQGNLLDNIIFTPFTACPDETTIVSNQGTVNFNPALNDFVPTASTFNVVSISGNGSAAFTGSNLALSSSSVGSYSVRYRVTNPDGDTSDSIVNVRVIPEVTLQLPNVLLVDPRSNFVDFPMLGLPNWNDAQICFSQVANSAGDALSDNATLTVDRTSNTTGITPTTTTNLWRFSGTRANLRTQIPSIQIQGLSSQVLAPSESKYIRVHLSSDTSLAGCADSQVDQIVEIRPLGLTNTLRKGTIQLK